MSDTKRQLSPAGKIYAAVTALVVWFALVVQIIVGIPAFWQLGYSTFGAVVQIFSYFTMLTNTLVALYLAVVVFAPRSRDGQFFLRSAVSTAVAMYIVFVGIIHTLLLRGGENPQGWAWLVNNLLHVAVPVMFLIYWLVFAPREKIAWKASFIWLIYPVLYLGYTLVRGAFTGVYPYPFVNVTTLGYSGALLNATLLTIVFWIVSLVFIGINRLLTPALNSEKRQDDGGQSDNPD